MKKETKILLTTLFIFAIIIIMFIFATFLIGLYNLDDDTMFICGLSLSSFASFIFILFVISSMINDLWKKKDKKGENNEKSNTK